MAGDKEPNRSETMAESCKHELVTNGLKTAALMVDFQAGKKIVVEGKDYELPITGEEREERLSTIQKFLGETTSKGGSDPKMLGDRFMNWLDADESQFGKGVVPYGDFETATGKTQGKSLYGAASRDFRAYWADKQEI